MPKGKGKTTMEKQIKETEFVKAWLSAQRSVMEVITKDEFDKLLKGESCQPKKSSKK